MLRNVTVLCMLVHACSLKTIGLLQYVWYQYGFGKMLIVKASQFGLQLSCGIIMLIVHFTIGLSVSLVPAISI